MNIAAKHKLSIVTVLSIIASSTIAFAQSFDTSLVKVIIIRPSNDMGAINIFKITINDTLILKLPNNSYYSFYTKQGVLHYRTDSQQNDDSIELEPGETNYLLLEFTYNFWKPKPNVFYIKPTIGQNLMAKHQPKDIRRPIQRHLFHVGLFFGGGAGFNDFNIIKTIDNEDVSFGFGGGLSAGVELGFEQSKHLDITVGYRYLQRGLTPTLQNASMAFSRHVFSLTPSFLLPLNSANIHRLKLGLGVDYYASNKLEIETGNIQNGIDDTWQYEPRVGYQARLSYEINFTDYFSFSLCTRYVDVMHQYKSSSKFFPTDPKFIRPRGNGIEVLLGIQFHF